MRKSVYGNTVQVTGATATRLYGVYVTQEYQNVRINYEEGNFREVEQN